MPKRKKSRKVGQIGTRSVPKDLRKPAAPSNKPKKRKGNPAGSRHSESTQAEPSQHNRGNQDPRIGSKKPIPLVVKQQPTKQPTKSPFFSPSQELKAIESDERLMMLLDRIDEGDSLSTDEQAYVEQRMDRHKALCDLLGIADEEAEESDVEDDGDDDLFDKLDATSLNQFRHK